MRFFTLKGTIITLTQIIVNYPYFLHIYGYTNYPYFLHIYGYTLIDQHSPDLDFSLTRSLNNNNIINNNNNNNNNYYYYYYYFQLHKS